MCGIVGYLGLNDLTDALSVPHSYVRRMADTLVSRGPDSDGYWLDLKAAIALGHRRLSIVDLSAAGAQPMCSMSGQFVLAFNGEIYNHLDLRSELARCGLAPVWRGHSDTETLLAGFDAWGISGTLERVVGMFAMAVWCRGTRTLSLTRDRLGEKPLYYGWQGIGHSAVFLFGSELKALRVHPSFGDAINRDALHLFMRFNNVSGSQSIYEGVHKLEPGCILRVSQATPEPVIETYWSAAAVARQGVGQPFAGSSTDAVDSLEALLKETVRSQMAADVPSGAFLSGGVDSSVIVALMQAQSGRPVKTFTIGFGEDGYNEAVYAKEVAAHLGTEHSELYVSAQQAMDVIPHLPTLYNEPFADSSQIPTFLVSQMARQHVTVALSGDAGDELFCGYNRYQVTASTWQRLSTLPLPMRRVAAWAITRLSPAAWNRFATATGISKRWADFGYKLHKGAGVLAAASSGDLYTGLVSQWHQPSQVVLGGTEPATLLTGLQPDLTGLNDVERMMALDMLTYLPDDILVKVDRAAMGVSLETRTPFLDHRVVEFAWQLPLAYKLRKENNSYITKWALRQVLYRHVPKAMIERPKMGFGVPIDSWLRGPLREWAEDLLSEHRLRNDGFFDPSPIRQKWAEHLSGQHNWQHQLWIVLMFQAWYEGTRR